jgi:hypothetical protein
MRHWSCTKFDADGSPPAYAIAIDNEHPPPSYLSTVAITCPTDIHRQSCSLDTSIKLSSTFSRYLMATGLMHMSIGLTVILCDAILTTMNESYAFSGIWTGVLNTIFGVYLIIFIGQSIITVSSVQRLLFIHIIMCLVSSIALMLSSINLATYSCRQIDFSSNRCHYSVHHLKIVLVILFASTFVQLCLNGILTCFCTRH